MKPQKLPEGRELFDAYSVGAKLRTLRNERGYTLSRLAAESKLSTALLSKLETERMIPTFATLARLCKIYGIGLSYFFGEVKEHSLSITRKGHLQNDGRARLSVKPLPLHLPTVQGKLTAHLLVIPTELSVTVSEIGGRTELVAYVLEGSLQLLLAGSTEQLGPGDCVVVATDANMIWSAAGKAPCRVLCVSAK